MAIGRINHGGAAIEHVVATDEQAVLLQNQTQVVCSVARGMNHLQGVRVTLAVQNNAFTVVQNWSGENSL